jgi:hypothetical protein
MVPCHDKDLLMLPHVLRLLRRHAVGIGLIFVVSAQPQPHQNTIDAAAQLDDTIWVPEDAYPVAKNSLRGDIYQQLLKLLFQRVATAALDQVLVCDADVLWLRPMHFVLKSNDQKENAEFDRGDRQCGEECDADDDLVSEVHLFTTTAITASPWDFLSAEQGGFGYPAFVEKLLGLPKGPKTGPDGALPATAIAHHMMLHRPTLEALFEHVRDRFSPDTFEEPEGPSEAWVVFSEALRCSSKPRSSEYALYHAFATWRSSSREAVRNIRNSGSPFSLHSAKPRATQSKIPILHVQERPLIWEDWGACCLDSTGRLLTPQSVDTTLKAGSKQVGTDEQPQHPIGEKYEKDWCDFEKMHDELAVHFDFIACHRHLRPSITPV